MSISLWDADLHVHTNLSYCAPRDTTPSSYLPYCEDEKLLAIGFSNHLYPDYRIHEEYSGANPGVERSRRILAELEEARKTTDVRLLYGCEVETVYGKEPSLPVEYAKEYDYILLAASHILNLGSDYAGFDFSTPERLRDMLINRFLFACELEYPVPTGICHPLYPVCSPIEQEIVDGFSDEILVDCFSLAAKTNKSIEIHASLYRNGTAHNADGISPSYLRLLSIAKSCGCKFHFGSDAHAPNAFIGVHDKLRLAARTVGITEADMFTLPALQ